MLMRLGAPFEIIDFLIIDCVTTSHQPPPPARAGQCRTAECWQLSTTDGAGGPTLLSIY